VRAHEVGRWPELRKWIRRNRTATAVACAALVALTSVLAWFSYTQGKSAVEIQRLGDLRRVEELEERAERLWPVVPALEPELARWLEEAEALASRAPEHERQLARLRESEGGGADKDLAWRIDALSALTDRLARFRDPYPLIGAIASVKKRLVDLRHVAQASSVDAAEAWSRAIAEIADDTKSPFYRGFALVPQFGLVPLGADPVTGLQEFAHVASGATAVRGADGRLVLHDDTGIVLVLVPGGSFHMGSVGSVAGQPPGPRTDPNADASEMPLTPVTLEPFFIAKHETTIGQWATLTASERAVGSNPLEPARSIAWTATELAFRHAGLALPTEAQWEYAARAGTTSRWWCGLEPGSLRGAANGARPASDTSTSGPQRVDSLRPNPFGLVHVLGNVAEWTRDVFAPYSIPPAGPEGLRTAPDTGLRSVRGGSFESPASRLRSAARRPVSRENVDFEIGARAARAIDRGAR
jgi:formylglycine-generating enzyme required for sulfatase activity